MPVLKWIRNKTSLPRSKREQGPLSYQNIIIGEEGVDVRHLIADGGFANVYKVKRRGERLAMKHILIGSQYEENDDSEVESLRKQTIVEIQIMKQLKGHPNVVRLESAEWNEAHGSFFILMEYCVKSLADALEEEETKGSIMSDYRILDAVHGIGQGLAYMHGQVPPLTHRDIKLQNVLLGKDNVWKLCDFGSTVRF